MAINIIAILEKYDKETKRTLAIDFIQEVFRDKSYKLSEYIRLILNEWIPIWLDERVDDREVIRVLERDLKMFI